MTRMNNDRSEPNRGCSSEETNTSLSSRESTTNQLKSHVVNFQESKTHLFYVIQSDNESNEKTKRFIRIKISKEGPTSKKFVTKKMSSRFGNNDDVTDENQEGTKRIPKRNLTSIHKRTDHPSFLVLPEVFSTSRGNVNVGKNIERNQSTSENSNETYVIRSKEENKIFANYRKVPTLLGASLWKINSQKVDAPSDGVVDQASTGDYCACDKVAARSLTNKSNRDSPNKYKTQTTASATNPSPAYLIKDDLFDIHFVQPTQQNASQRLRAGQDYDRRYQSCHMCPNMTKIFPPTSTRRREPFQSHFSDSGSNSTVKNRSGYVKINFKLVRQCLICGSVKEKCQVLDAIRLRMKSPDFDLAMNTIEDIVKSDLFGVQCECRSKPLLEELFWPINVKESHQLQSSIAQFINALVSYQMGRNYFSNRSIIRMLIWGDMGRDNIDAIMRDNLIGIMMKLSCSRFQRSDMIKNGLISWLLQRMEDDEYSASKYQLQCMAGLLRNLLRGYNLDAFSPIEMRKLLVLLGRYLNSESATAKRYICDCLITLLQSTTNVASAKELNFQKVIEEHVTRSVNSKQKEHLRAVYELLNRSKTSKPFNSQKFASLSEEDPFSDVDLESNNSEEVDYYPGEVLLRDKYSGDAGALGDKKNLKSNPMADDSRKDGKLISRVFVEQLNCFLPEIDKNRIFPLCNARCADKIATCSHIGGIQPKKRQPYIPPNLRAPGLTQHKQSIDDSVDGSSFGPSDKRLKSAKQLIQKISTISHDKSAAKWHHFEDGDDGSQNATKNKMERIFVGPPGGISERNNLSSTSGGITEDRLDTELPINSESEAFMRSISFHRGSTEEPDTLNDKDKNLIAQDSDSSIRKSSRKDKSVKRESQLYDTKKILSRQPQENISEDTTLHKETEFSATDDVETHKVKETEFSATEDLETHKVIVSKKGDDRLSLGTSDSLTQQSTKEIAKQTNTGENETDRELYDKSKKVKNIHKTTSESKTEILNEADQKPVEQTNTDFNETSHKLHFGSIEVRSPPILGGKKTLDENLTESQTNRAKESKVTPTTKLHARPKETLELSRKARKLSPGPASRTTQKLHAQSTEEQVGETLRKNLVGKEIDRDLLVESTDISNLQAAKTSRDDNQPPLLNVRSENLLKKITSEGTAKEIEVTTKLHARSAETLDHSRKAQKLSTGPASKTEALEAQKDADTNKMDPNTQRFFEAPTKLQTEKNINANEITEKLHARSIKEKVGETRKKNSKKEIDRDLCTETKWITDSKAAEKTTTENSNQPLPRKTLPENAISLQPSTAMQPVCGVKSDHLTSDAPAKSNPLNAGLHARSEETVTKPKASPTVITKTTNYLLLQHDSDDLLGSVKHQEYALEPIENENSSEVKSMFHQLPARSTELVTINRNGIERTQSATALGAHNRSRDRISNTAFLSGYSSQSSMNKSDGCVDCEGSGYVLRARPSQPCERCKVSLSKYPKFVNALNNQVSEDYERRVVSRTSDDCIKVTWVEKSDEKISTTPNQGKSNKETLDETGGKSTETKMNAKGNTSSPKDKSPTENVINKTKENVTKDHEVNLMSCSEGDAIVASYGKSFFASAKPANHVDSNECQPTYLGQKAAKISDGEQSSDKADEDNDFVIHSANSGHLHRAETTGVNLNPAQRTCNGSRLEQMSNYVADSNKQNNQSDSQPKVSQHLLPRPAEDFLNSNSSLTNNVSSTKDKKNVINEHADYNTSGAKKERRLSLQITDEKTKRRSNSASSIPSKYKKGLSLIVTLSRSGSDKHLSFGTVREKKVVGNVTGETIVSSKDDRCLRVVTVTKSNKIYNGSVNTDLEMERLTSSKEQAVEKKRISSTDDEASNNLLHSNESQPKLNQISVQKPSETTPAVNKSNDETQNFELKSLKALPQEEIDLPSGSIRFETERLSDVATSRNSLQKLITTEIRIESHEKLNGAPLNNEVTVSENNTFVTPASGMKSALQASETKVDEKIIGTKSNEPTVKISETIPNSLTASEDSTSQVMSVSTRSDRPGIGGDEIGRAKSSTLLSSNLSKNSKVETPTTDDPVAHNLLALDNGKLDEASNTLSTLNEQKIIANRCGSSSTEELEDKQMNNLGCDATAPLANPNEENLNNSPLNYETIGHNPRPIPGLNLGKLARLFPSELRSDAVNSVGVNSAGVIGGQVLAARPNHIVIGGIAVAVVMAAGQLLAARSTNIITEGDTTDARVGQAGSSDVVRAETTVQQTLAARSLDAVRDENTVQQVNRRSLSESLEKLEQVDVASSLNFVRGDNAVQQDDQRTLSESLGKREQPVVVAANGGQILAASSWDVASGELSVHQDNKNLLRDSMTKSVVVDTGYRPVLAARSLVNIREKTAVQTSIHKATLKSNAKIIEETKTNFLPLKSNEMALANFPIRKRKVDVVDNKCENQTENVVMNKLVKIIEKEAATKQGNGKELTDSNEMFRSKMSTVFDDILIKEMNLRSETQTERNDPEINQELSHGHFRFSGGERERKGRHKVRFVNSTCCRQLLNNEELINRLSEKVLEKLVTEIHNCGPNCKSPCGGLNSKFNAKTGNYRNLE